MNIKKSKIAAILLLSIMFFSCVRKADNIQPVYEKTEVYQIDRYNEIKFFTIRNCQYLLINTQRGTDIEHFEGCENPKHYKKSN